MNADTISASDVANKKITCLVHFTKVENIPSILGNGLLSREVLAANPNPPSFVDQYRLDGYTNGICLSISFPNYKMFYSARMSNPDTQWAVLLLDKSILWEKNCAFFSNNAASSEFQNCDIVQKKTRTAFLSLFDEQEKTILENDEQKTVKVREVYQLPTSYPTNPQAEVICFDKIEASYIRKIYFQNSQNCEAISTLTKISCVADKQAFDARIDYAAWK